jgi:hypothetical protein
VRIAIYDTEPLRGPQIDKDGRKVWGDKAHAGLSCGVVWCNWSGGNDGRYLLFGPGEHEGLASVLESADLVVDFNGLFHDKPLLETLCGRDIAYQRHCDLYVEFRDQTKEYCSLESLANATLGESKPRVDSAPKLVAADKWSTLFSKCMRDVEYTKRIFFHVAENGYVLRHAKTKDGYTGTLRQFPLHVPTGRPAIGNAPVCEPKQELASDNQIDLLQKLYREAGVDDDWHPEQPITKRWAWDETKRLKRLKAERRQQ